MADEYRASGIPFLRSLNVRPHRIDITDAKYIGREFHERLKKSSIRPGDVVTVRTGKPGQTAVIPDWLPEANCSDLVITRPGPGLDARWLSYYLNWITDSHIAVHLVGAVQQHFNVKSAQAIVLDLPHPTEQRAIAEVLGALDDKIAANEHAARDAEALMQALHRRAVQGSGAVVRALFDVFAFDFGEAFKGDQFGDLGHGRPLIRIRDLKTLTPRTWTVESRANEVTVQPGDVLVGMDAEFRPVIWLGDPGLLNQRVCRVRGKGFGDAFVACALHKPLNALEKEKSATTVIHLNKADLKRSVVQIPSASALAEFEAAAEPILRSRVALALESRRLSATRDGLLPLLMAGKVRVREAEKVVEGAL
ncbi:restriction endonuclease subunit S [Kribbella sp. NPDC049227]|uniref:restriction endonuclease subunit S n=1 Tax=Kribbella sp. NPDC049227 TaxID=3364113 RepID=UPI00371AF678